jgi:hypothetical protein
MMLRALLLLALLLAVAVAAAPVAVHAVWLETYTDLAHCQAATAVTDAMVSLGAMVNGTGCYFDANFNVAYQASCSADGKTVNVGIFSTQTPLRKVSRSTHGDS